MRKYGIALGLGLLPLWLGFIAFIIGLFVRDPFALLSIIAGAVASMVTLPIVLVAMVAYRRVAGGARAKWLVSAAVAVSATALIALLIYHGDVMTGRREARIDQELALEYARNSTVLAQVAGNGPIAVRSVAVTDNRLARSLLLGPLEQNTAVAQYFPAKYLIEARGARVVYAHVTVTRLERGGTDIHMDCCRKDSNLSHPYRSDY